MTRLLTQTGPVLSRARGAGPRLPAAAPAAVQQVASGERRPARALGLPAANRCVRYRPVYKKTGT